MGAWQIPLQAAHAAPGPNAFDYAERGQQGALTAQAMMQQQQAQQQEQQLRAQQIQGAELQNQQAQLAMQNTAALNQAWQAGWGVNQDQTQPAQPAASAPPAAGTPAPAQPPAAPAPAPPESGFMSPSGEWVQNPAAAAQPSAPPANGAQSLMAPSSGADPAAAAPAPAHPMQSHVPGSPLPSFNFNAVVDSLVRSGHGALVPGMMQGNTELLTKQAALLKDQTANHTALAAAATQLLQGIPQIHGDSPEDTQQLRDRAYQRILPQLSDVERKLDPNSQLPSAWDDQTGQQMIANGTTVTDFNNRQHQAAALALQMQTDAPKSAAEAEAQVQHSVGNVTTQQQYDDVRARYQALADYEQKVNPNGTSFYASALKNLPAQWSKDVSLQAQLDPLKPEDRVKFFQSRLDMTSQRLAAAAQQGQAAYAYELANTDPTERSLFPPANGTFDPKQVSTQAAQVGMTGAQRITAQSIEQFRAQMVGIRQDMFGLAQQRFDATQSANGGPKPLTQGQIQVEQRNIANQEYGTASRPGVYAQRHQIAVQLGTGKLQTKSGENEDDARQRLQAQYDALTDTTQSLQYRKADLYRIGKPNPMDVQSAQNGDEVTANDGSTWKKIDGVAYFSRRAGAPTPAGSSQAAASTPASSQPPATPVRPGQVPVPAQPKPAPAASAPTPAPKAPAQPAAGPVTINLPNGKPYTFASQAALDDFVKKHNLTLSQK